jgi:hypothetical protein
MDRAGAILGTLKEDSILPEEAEEGDFNLKKECELCEAKFRKLKGINRHHCRKCNKSVCGPCSSNQR